MCSLYVKQHKGDLKSPITFMNPEKHSHITNQKKVSDHLLHFTNKWARVPADEIPLHIEEILLQILNTPMRKQRRMFVFNDEMFVAKYRPRTIKIR